LEQAGKSVWVDTEGIEDGQVFPEAIRSAIEGSDAFVFVITPESVASRYCEQEVALALELHKRVVPVLRSPVADDGLPEAIRVRSWIPYTADVDAEVAGERLSAALDKDLEHAQAHTRWLVKALDWESHARDRSFLVRGSELASAEQWLAGVGPSADPAPTTLQREFLLTSRRASARRQRVVVVASLAAVVVAVALAVVALISRSQAQTARARATRAAAVSQSRLLAADGQSQLSVDPELSVLLGMAAVRSWPTTEGMAALRDTLDASPVRFRLPNVGAQSGAYGGDLLAYSRDGRWLAESSQDRFVAIMDARTGSVIRRITTPGASYVAGWSPDGKLLLVGTPRAALLIDPMTGATRAKITAFHYSVGMAFSPDGSTVYGTGLTPQGWKANVLQDGHPLVRPVWVGSWSLVTGRYRAFTLPPSTSAWAVQGLAIANSGELALRPGGRQIAVAAVPGLAVFDTRTGRPVRVIAPRWPRNAFWGSPIPPGADWDSLAYSPDGSLLAGAETGTGPNGNVGAFGEWIRVLDARTLRVRETAATPTAITQAVAFSPDGSRVAWGTFDGTAAVYSLRLHRQLVNLPGQTGAVVGLAFSPDGGQVATTTADGDGRVWRAAGNERLLVTAPASAPQTVMESALRGDRIVALLTPASGPDKGKIVVQSWSRTDGRPLGPPLVVSSPSFLAYRASLSGDGRFVAVIDLNNANTYHWLHVWNIAQRRIVQTFDLGIGYNLNLDTAQGWSANDRYLAIPLDANGFQLFDIHTDRFVSGVPRATCASTWQNAVAWSPDGSRLAATDQCGNLRIWSLSTGRLVYKASGLGDNVEAAGFSPDGKRLILTQASTPGSVTVIDSRTGRTQLNLVGIIATVDRAFFSPDGRFIATSSEDGMVRIWNAQTGALLRTIPQPETGPTGVSFGPDSSSILTVDDANIIRIYATCPDCENAAAMLAVAKARVTRGFTPDEKQLYHVG
jgi:WD40 repeat protein